MNLSAQIVEVGPKSVYLPAVRAMVKSYAKYVHQNWKEILWDFSDYLYDEPLPGRYARPHGGLWVARIDGFSTGCVGLCTLGQEKNPLTDGELKRLFVFPAFRGFGIAAQLVGHLIDESKAIGYDRLWVESSNRFMNQVYIHHGFKPASAQDFHDLLLSRFGSSYYRLPSILNPIPGTEYLKVVLN